jgi:hypothetical protein
MSKMGRVMAQGAGPTYRCAPINTFEYQGPSSYIARNAGSELND